MVEGLGAQHSKLGQAWRGSGYGEGVRGWDVWLGFQGVGQQSRSLIIIIIIILIIIIIVIT